MALRRIGQKWNSRQKLWALPALVFLVSFLIGWIGLNQQTASPEISYLVIVFLSATIGGLVYRFLQLQANQRMTLAEVQQLSRQICRVNDQIMGVYQLSSLYSQAKTENDIIEGLLKVCITLVGARGASFVPLDDHHQPMAARSQGELPFPAMNSWVEYLANPSVRQRCRNCQSQGKLNTSCPLIQGPFTEVTGLFCLPLHAGNRELGILNLYLPNTARLEPETQTFLNTLLQDTALALETKRMRQRELDAIQQMLIIQQKSDLSGLLTSLLENIQAAFNADLAQIEMQTNSTQRRIAVGETDEPTEAAVRQAIESSRRAGAAIQMLTPSRGAKSSQERGNLIAVPLFSSQKKAMGALVVVNQADLQNQAHQLTLLHAFAAQVELLLENADLLAHLEYRTIVEERARLAREIHDGLAQTLGLLKLQSLQAIHYLNKSDLEKLHSTLSRVHETLSEAYQDIRAAIDGLRLNADPQGSLAWIAPMLKEFEELSGIDAHLELQTQPSEVPVEIQAQLMRIVQEALNNIRKHSQAKNAWLFSAISSGDWWLEIRDDGVGFMPEDIPTASRYGLIGMRERAELIGADFQIVSQPGQGAQIHLRLPEVMISAWNTPDLGGSTCE